MRQAGPFADNILLYHTIKSKEDYMALQKDVDALNSWSNDNYFKFNPTKCKFMMLSRKRGIISNGRAY